MLQKQDKDHWSCFCMAGLSHGIRGGTNWPPWHRRVIMPSLPTSAVMGKPIGL